MGLGKRRKSEDEVSEDEASEDEVKVHVSFYGGLYVDPSELLRSKAAQDKIKRANEVLFGSPSVDAKGGSAAASGEGAASSRA